MTDFVQVSTATENREAAVTPARSVVEARLAAGAPRSQVAAVVRE